MSLCIPEPGVRHALPLSVPFHNEGTCSQVLYTFLEVQSEYWLLFYASTNPLGKHTVFSIHVAFAYFLLFPYPWPSYLVFPQMLSNGVHGIRQDLVTVFVVTLAVFVECLVAYLQLAHEQVGCRWWPKSSSLCFVFMFQLGWVLHSKLQGCTALYIRSCKSPYSQVCGTGNLCLPYITI